MAENSKIAWTDHTFNPWIGCAKVSLGCENCYAETLNNRYGWAEWGLNGKRKRTVPANWKKPIKWNKSFWFDCLACGHRGDYADLLDDGEDYSCPKCESVNIKESKQRVFCASLSDVFEDRPELEAWRIDLFRLIIDTPNLDWLILTKRPENVNKFIDRACWPETGCPIFDEKLPYNVWIGTSTEDQKQADKRIPELLKIPASKHFLSMEPLLGPVSLAGVDGGTYRPWLDWGAWPILIDLVIVGGESGPKARPMQEEWALDIRDQCKAASVPFFMKQMSGKAEIPNDLFIREFPND